MYAIQLIYVTEFSVFVSDNYSVILQIMCSRMKSKINQLFFSHITLYVDHEYEYVARF